MRLIKIKRVLFVSSQDEEHPISDIVNSVGTVSSKKWLSSPRDNARKLEAEFELESPTVIRRIDIGNCGSGAVEILAKNTSWPSHIPYKTLLDNVTLRSFEDVKNNSNFNNVKFFTDENFHAEAKNRQFNRIKIICCQPYMQPFQFGLSFLNFRTDDYPLQISTENFYSHDSEENILPLMERIQKYNSINKSYTSRGKQMVDVALSKNKNRSTPLELETPSSEDIDMNEFGLNAVLFLTSKNKEDFFSVDDAIKNYERCNSVTLNDLEIKSFSDLYESVCLSSQGTNHLFNDQPGSSTRKRHFNNSIDDDIDESKQNKKVCQRPDFFDKPSSSHSPQIITISDPDEPLSPTTYRPEDFIQQDGSIPSTSSVTSFADCPICLRQFHTSKIETHAALCENYCKPNIDSSDDEEDGTESIIQNQYRRTKC